MRRASNKSAANPKPPEKVEETINPLDGYTWPAVTRELMDGLAEDKIVDALYWYICKQGMSLGSWTWFLKGLPRGLQIVHHCNNFWGEVFNGGAGQYFSNNKSWFFLEGPRAFREFGAKRTAGIIEKLTNVYLHGEKERWYNDDGDLMGWEYPDLYKWDDYLFDTRNSNTDFRKLGQWIRKHPEQCLHTPKKRRAGKKQPARRRRGK